MRSQINTSFVTSLQETDSIQLMFSLHHPISHESIIKCISVFVERSRVSHMLGKVGLIRGAQHSPIHRHVIEYMTCLQVVSVGKPTSVLPSKHFHALLWTVENAPSCLSLRHNTHKVVC